MTLLLFAAGREAFATPTVQCPGFTRVSQLVDWLKEQKPAREKLWLACRFARGDVFLNADDTLQADDTIAVIPPVSGG